MQDHGRPGMFTAASRESKCPCVPARYCELQIVRFRKLAVVVERPCAAPNCREESLNEFDEKMKGLKVLVGS